MKSIKFTVTAVSSEEKDYRAKSLENLSSAADGWRSKKYCPYPQCFTCIFDAECFIRQIQFLTHSDFVPESTTLESFDPTKKISLGTVCKVESSITDVENERHRHLHTISITGKTKMAAVKFIFHRNLCARVNPHNQVSIVAVHFTGSEIFPADEQNLQRYDLGYLLYMDKPTRQILDKISAKKTANAQGNRGNYVRRLAAWEEELRKMGFLLGKVEWEKQQAIKNDDFKTADGHQQRQLKYRKEMLRILNIDDLLEQNGEILPENDRAILPHECRLPSYPLAEPEDPKPAIRPQPLQAAATQSPKIYKPPFRFLTVHFHINKNEASTTVPPVNLPREEPKEIRDDLHVPKGRLLDDKPPPRPRSASLPTLSKRKPTKQTNPEPVAVQRPVVRKKTSNPEDRVVSGLGSHQAVDANDADRIKGLKSGPDTELPLAVYGKATVGDMCSQQFSKREETLKSVQTKLAQYVYSKPASQQQQQDSGAATGSTKTSAGSQLSRKSSVTQRRTSLPRVDKKPDEKGCFSPVQMFRASLWFVLQGLRDAVPSVSMQSCRTLTGLIKFSEKHHLSEAELNNAVSMAAPLLLSRGSDTNPRLHSEVADTLAQLAVFPPIKSKGLILNMLAQPVEGHVAPRLTLTKLQALMKLTQSDALENDKKWETNCRQITKFATSAMLQNQESVRLVARQLLLKLYPKNRAVVRRIVTEQASNSSRLKDVLKELDAVDRQVKVKTT